MADLAKCKIYFHILETFFDLVSLTSDYSCPVKPKKCASSILDLKLNKTGNVFCFDTTSIIS